ncbi:tetratricopeptide repeat protein [Paraburkholderia phosphatilytica]|uniref:tetratricopeptide repeat-containing glycosyltransferase family protein n=1 Tax=Paraburkholderia phosphatilytica TaxID=2282883 RepID=UPI000E50AE10|nr:tetratricopeptide repeat-containing glycosyltransferase family protein [Paraburkholderia phosphatilytica]
MCPASSLAESRAERVRTAASLCAGGRFVDALSMLNPLLRPDAGCAPADLGRALDCAAVCSLALGHTAEAEVLWRQSIKLVPAFADAYNNLGIVLKTLGRLLEAEAVFAQGVAACPEHAELANNLGTAHHARGCHADAVLAFSRAVTIRPDYAEAHYNLGIALHELRELDAAVAAYRDALRVRPDYAEAHLNLGNVLRELTRFADADCAYRSALALRPDYHAARYAHAMLLLSIGRFDEGWRLHEARYDRPSHSRSPAILRCAQWRGEPLAGKSILVWQEDGLGDMIQFGRYFATLKALGAAYVAFACDPALHRLFATVNDIDSLLTPDIALAASAGFDGWTSLLSVPLHAGLANAALPAPLALRAEDALVGYWREHLAVLPPGPRIGVVWKGNPLHQNDAHRSLPSLGMLAPLLRAQGMSFVSLQKGAGEDEALTPPAGVALLHLGSSLRDFADTAAVVSQLDLVICVDTSIAHLAASLGKRCWVMLPDRQVDWRWGYEGNGSAWYPDTVRLFRRATGESWQATAERLRQACVEQFSLAQCYAERMLGVAA